MDVLPPRFGLHAVGEAILSILKRNSADEATEAVRPVRVGCKETQYGSAEELAACPDLRCDREFAEPPAVLTITAARVIEPALEREGEMISKEDLWPGAKRDPLIPPISRIAVLRPLVDEDRHDGESVIC